MSEADKLFEELGYEKYEHNIFAETLKGEDWVTQDESYIKYLDIKVINGTYYLMFIMFMMNNKRVQIGGYEKGISYYGKRYEMLRNPILNLQELKAIQMKCKELGWK